MIFLEYPDWVLWVLRIRDFIVKPLGLKTKLSFENMIIEQDHNRIILGTKDKHRTFCVSEFCPEITDSEQVACITTSVKYKRIAGKIYFAVIWLFHRIVVDYLFKRAIGKWNNYSVCT